MKETKSFECLLEVVEAPDALNKNELWLLDEALNAAEKAYAPYSDFHVGAALQLEDGTLIHGCNQENSAYPSGLCAERVAFFTAGIQHKGKKITGLAITVRSARHNDSGPAVPCGACLQVLREVEKRQNALIPVLLKGSGPTVWKADGLINFLPFSFDL
jgi:cytidine deaminase